MKSTHRNQSRAKRLAPRRVCNGSPIISTLTQRNKIISESFFFFLPHHHRRRRQYPKWICSTALIDSAICESARDDTNYVFIVEGPRASHEIEKIQTSFITNPVQNDVMIKTSRIRRNVRLSVAFKVCVSHSKVMIWFISSHRINSIVKFSYSDNNAI